MPRRIWKDKTLLVFLAVAFFMGFMIQGLGFVDSSRRWTGFALWVPTLAVLAMGRPGLLVLSSLRRFESRWILTAAVLGLVPSLLSQAFFAFSDLGVWNQALFPTDAAGQTAASGRFRLMLGNEAQSFPYLGLNLALSFAFAAAVSSFGAGLGQEIGWRGFLLPNLTAKYGIALATLLTATAWALWQAPTHWLRWSESPDRFLLVFVVMPLTTLALSVPLSWLRLRSGAVWPCAFFLGTHTAFSGLRLWRGPSDRVEGLVGLAGAGLIGLLFFWILERRSTPEQLRGHHPAAPAAWSGSGL